MEGLARYDRQRTYQWNYDHPPTLLNRTAAPVAGEWTFCGRSVDSPLGIAAGPLLNGQWCLYYAGLGFDVVTYKTVRHRQRDCYPLPNLLPVKCDSLDGSEPFVQPADEMLGSWAVSFGMPSTWPETWRQDIAWTRENLPTTKLLSVSVVGTMQEGWSINELAEDYAQTAAWAVESGADCIETNFSCPNVSTCDGQLYLDFEASRQVASAVKSAIGDCPLAIKIGHMRIADDTKRFMDAVGEHVSAIAMTNSIAAPVGVTDQQLLFDRQPRGICGRAIRDASIRQVEQFSNSIQKGTANIEIIGIGGIETAADVKRYLDAGASSCHLATAVMIDPSVGLKIREDLST